MIILGGFPSGIVFGSHGITPAQIVSGGNAASPLLNDVDPGDTTTELLWRLEPPYLTVGVTTATDTGVYAVTGLPDGTHLQPYSLFPLPATGNPSSSTSTITTVVGTVAPAFAVQPVNQSVLTPGAAQFTYSVVGASSVQAQRRANSLAAWADVAGATLTGYTTPATSLTDNGAQFRFVASGAGGVAPSSIVGLSVSSAASLMADPRMFEDMLSRVLPYVRNCPPQTAIFHLREAARDFFQRTLAWRSDLPRLSTVVGQASYSMVIPQETTVAKLLAYAIDGQRNDVIDAELGMQLQLEEAGTQMAWSEDRSTVSINPAPLVAGVGLDFRVALKPSEDASAIPGAMVNHYIDNLADGAIARLLEMPGCDWTDPKTAPTYRGKYELAVARVSRMSAKGFSRPAARKITF
jgi:hypothetical protein